MPVRAGEDVNRRFGKRPDAAVGATIPLVGGNRVEHLPGDGHRGASLFTWHARCATGANASNKIG